jgi:hypothetical protein
MRRALKRKNENIDNINNLVCETKKRLTGLRSSFASFFKIVFDPLSLLLHILLFSLEDFPSIGSKKFEESNILHCTAFLERNTKS